MSYFDKQDDPWGSSFGSSAPAYSFGEQPAAPQPTFKAPQPTYTAPESAFAAPQPTLASLEPTFAAPVSSFDAPQTNIAAPQPTFVGPKQTQVITIQPNSGSFNPQRVSEDGNYGQVEYLDGVRRVVVQQRLSLIEAVTGLDRRNKYDMWDADTGEVLFFGQENDIGDGGCQGHCIRHIFKGHREAEIPLQMAVNDVNSEYGGKGKYHLSKARAIGLYPCQCGCCATCTAACYGCCGFCSREACCGTCWIEKGFARLSTYFKGNETHKIQQRDGGCGKASFVITDEVSKRIVYEIVKEELCVAAICCNDVPFPIFDANGQEVGSITKYWAGGKTGCSACWQEANNASTHVIVFPASASHSEKLAIIGQAMLIDYTFYQMNNDDNGS